MRAVSIMASALIELNCVSREFDGGQVQALREVDLRVDPGEWLTIVGPSGSGKSTLLNLMCGLDLPSTGEVRFEGRPPSSAAAWTRIRARRLGFIFQSYNLLPTLTALENVQIPMFGVYGRRERLKRARELLARVGLTHRAGHRPGNLSGGERQRVAIARSLGNSPALILADEPTGNLDSQSSQQIIQLLQEIYAQDRTAVVLVTHNPVVAQCGNRWIKLKDGEVKEETRTEAVAECCS
jgi:putative ABC transport system ATP-binding protein